MMGASRSKLGSGSLLARRYPFNVVVFLLRSWTKTSRGDRAACPLTPLVPLVVVPFVPLVPLEMPFETMLGDVICECQDEEDNVELLFDEMMLRRWKFLEAYQVYKVVPFVYNYNVGQ